MTVVKVPDIEGPECQLCWKQAPSMERCDRAAGHAGPHTWELSFSRYQNGVVKTWDCGKTEKDRLLNAVLGIAGESGEYADLIKKQEFHGIPADSRAVLKELGDILYYVTAAAMEHGYTLEQVAITNNQKLAARYPEGFKLGGGIRE